MHIRALLLVAVIGGLLSAEAAAQSAVQQVTIVVKEVTAISSAGTVTLTIQAASDAGDELAPVSVSTYYNMTTNGTDKKIVAELDDAFPPGISLAASMEAPSARGSSAGQVDLGTGARALVTGLSRLRDTNVPLTYTASASVDVEPGSSATRTVTFTVTNS